MKFLCEGTSKVWCPRVIISTDMRSLLNEPSHSGGNHSSKIFPLSAGPHPHLDPLVSINATTMETRDHQESKICLGRGLVYREERSERLILKLNVFVVTSSWSCLLTGNSAPQTRNKDIIWKLYTSKKWLLSFRFESTQRLQLPNLNKSEVCSFFFDFTEFNF
jgi:hypothetical protein